MRMYDKSVILFQADKLTAPPIEVLEEFVPVAPMRAMEGTEATRAKERPSKHIGGLGADSPLYCMSKKLLTVPRERIFKRVVVVAGSPHSYTLLESLSFIPNMTFPNLYVVFDRLPLPFIVNSNNEEFTKYDDDYSGCMSSKYVELPTENELYAMGLASKCFFMTGSLTDIDRQNKAVVINDEIALKYDVLVLSSSTQDNTTLSIPALMKMHPAQCADMGVFSLGNPSADFLAVKWIKKRSPKADPIAIFGNYLDALCATTRLLSLGVEAKRIAMVVPDEPSSLEGVDDKNIMEKLVGISKAIGVKISWGSDLKDVSTNKHGFIQDISIRSLFEDPAAEDSPKSDTKLATSALLLCYKRFSCTRDVFFAVNDAGLVFNGGMIVDETFCTVDACIYAVSDYTRFSRSYLNAGAQHHRFNPRELGLFVSAQLLAHHLDPRSPHYATSASGYRERDASPALPTFRLPRSFSMVLPNKVHYFISQLPTLPDDVLSFPASFVDEVGPSHRKVSRYCTLKLGNYGVVCGVVYIGEDEVEMRNLSVIAGYHESVLNCAIYTYEKGLIDDWILFFRQPWAGIIYHDKFPLLVERLRTVLTRDGGMMKVMDQVMGFGEANGVEIQEDIIKFRRELVGPYCEKLSQVTSSAIANETVDFLKKNRSVLSQYYISG